MKRKQFLGEVELEILTVVWKSGEATVQDVLDDILTRRKAAYTSVMTMMKNLAQKGFLKHRTEGRSFVYSPAISQDEIKRSLLKDTVDSVFQGSSVELLQNLLDQEALGSKEIEELKKLIEDL